MILILFVTMGLFIIGLMDILICCIARINKPPYIEREKDDIYAVYFYQVMKVGGYYKSHKFRLVNNNYKYVDFYEDLIPFAVISALILFICFYIKKELFTNVYSLICLFEIFLFCAILVAYKPIRAYIFLKRSDNN